MFQENLLQQLIATLIYSGVGILVFMVAWYLIARLMPFSVRKEIEEDQNTALGIVIGSIFIGLAVIIAAAII